MTPTAPVIQWLLGGDPAIRWQTLRDLAGASKQVVEQERKRVAETGWGARLLRFQEPSGQWGCGIYTPKWASTTYTTVLLRSLGLPPGHPQALKACLLLLEKGFYRDGGFSCWRSCKHSETCVTGMILAVGAYFRLPDPRLGRMADYLMEQQMKDGGWNCQSYDGATHSSVHTAIAVPEGLLEFERFAPDQAASVRAAQAKGRQLLLAHRPFRSHRTGKVINPAWTRFSFPPRGTMTSFGPWITSRSRTPNATTGSWRRLRPFASGGRLTGAGFFRTEFQAVCFSKSRRWASPAAGTRSGPCGFSIGGRGVSGAGSAPRWMTPAHRALCRLSVRS